MISSLTAIFIAFVTIYLPRLISACLLDVASFINYVDCANYLVDVLALSHSNGNQCHTHACQL